MGTQAGFHPVMPGPRPILLLAATLLLASLAGCSGEPAAETPEVEPAIEELGLVATEETGIVRGVAVDEAIRPVANVTVELRGGDAPQTTTTNDGGAFGFDGLAPGTYFLEASKAGYFSVQQSVEVVAGLADPPVAKILLKVDAATIPFVNVQVFDGFIECTTSFLVLCGAPNLVMTLWCNGDLGLPPQCLGNVTNDRFTNDFYFADNASLIQFEMAWQSNQALSPEMFFEVENLNGGCDGERADERNGGEEDDVSSYMNNTNGPSPIYATINASQIHVWEIGSICPVYFSVFSGGIPGTPCGDADPTGTLPGWCVGFTLEQRFTLFVHDFHHFLPPPGWRFTVDGPPVVPV